MGRGCSRTVERVAAAIGFLQEAPLKFSRSIDVVNGGVLFALPALLVNGLLGVRQSIFRNPRVFTDW